MTGKGIQYAAMRYINAIRGQSFSLPPARRLALTNLFRPGNASVSMVIALGTGLTLMVALALVASNIHHQLTDHLPEDAPSFFLFDIQPDQRASLAQDLVHIHGVQHPRMMPMLRGYITHINGVSAQQAVIAPEARWAVNNDRGISYSAVPPEGSKVVEGHWWAQDYRGSPLISFDAALAKGMGVGIGDTLTVNVLGRDITGKIANLRENDWASLRMSFAIVFSSNALHDAPQTWLGTLVAHRDAEREVLALLSAKYPNVSVLHVGLAVQQASQLLKKMAWIVFVTAGLTVLAGILVMGAATAATLEMRLYDSVILKVLGATRGYLLKILGIEFSILTATTALLGASAGTIAAYGVMQLMIFTQFFFYPSTLILITFFGLFAAMAIAISISMRILSVKPLLLLRNE